MKEVLITGGLGGVGYHVTRRFLEADVPVRLLELDVPSVRKRLRSLPREPQVVWGDVTNRSDVDRALEGMDMVTHLAAIIPPRADAEPELTLKVNVGGTRTVVEALQGAGRQIPLVFTSSIAVFGDTRDQTPPLHPDRNPMAPNTAYERSKAEAEMLVRNSGLDFLVLRLGANPPVELSLSKFREMFIVPYDTRIEFTHVQDTAVAIFHGVQRFEKVKNRVFIVSGGPANQMYYHEFIARSMAVLGLPCPPKEKFSKGPSHLDWYDTIDSQHELEFQSRTFDDYLHDLYRPIPRVVRTLMRYLIGPVFGRLIVRFM
ncbi:MAG: NAD(P)-dependent oxidoreductase [Dehalococcoidia bacterium]